MGRKRKKALARRPTEREEEEKRFRKAGSTKRGPDQCPNKEKRERKGLAVHDVVAVTEGKARK